MPRTERAIQIRLNKNVEIQAVVGNFVGDRDQLENKILSTLEDGDEGMLLNPEFDSRPFYLTWIYQNLNELQKEQFRYALLALLENLGSKPERFNNSVADDLLLIIPDICKPDKKAASIAAKNLKKLIKNREAIEIPTPVENKDIAVSLQARAIQSLVGLETKENLSFWEKLANDYSGIYDDMILHGIINLDFDIGIKWIIKHQDSKGVQSAFLGSLAYYFKEKFGEEKTDKAIQELIPQVSAEFAKMLTERQKEIKDWLKNEPDYIRIHFQKN